MPTTEYTQTLQQRLKEKEKQLEDAIKGDQTFEEARSIYVEIQHIRRTLMLVRGVTPYRKTVTHKQSSDEV